MLTDEEKARLALTLSSSSTPRYEYKTVAIEDDVETTAQNYANQGWRTVSVFEQRPVVEGLTLDFQEPHLLLEREVPKNPFDRYDTFNRWLQWQMEHYPGINPFDPVTDRRNWHWWEDEYRGR